VNRKTSYDFFHNSVADKTPLVRKLLPRLSRARLSHPAEATQTQGQLFRPTPSQASPRHRLPYIAGLDGIRAIAVAVVVLYHLGISWMPGGFLGVEVFFVVSGYLITALLLGEWEKTSTISLKRFWLRRARRLLPALAAVLAAVTIFVTVAFRDELDELWSQLAAAATYVTNWLLIFQDQSYFASFGRPEVLQHLWSLAVEEQFYLLWPLLFFAGMRLFKRTGFTIVVAIGIVASTAWMWLLFEPLQDPSRIYYGTDTRASGLLLGALLALLWRPWLFAGNDGAAETGAETATTAASTSKKLRLAANIAGPLALAGVVWWCVYLTELDEGLYKGGFLWLAATTALLIAAIAVPNTWFGKVMDNPVMRWVGVRSYAIYLWHWPVFVFTRPRFDVTIDGWPLHVIRVGASLLLADLSYRLVENPIRTRQLRPTFKRWVGELRQSWRGYLTPLGAVTSVTLVVAVIIVPQVSHTTPALTGNYFILELDDTPEAVVQPLGGAQGASGGNPPANEPTPTDLPPANRLPADPPPRNPGSNSNPATPANPNQTDNAPPDTDGTQVNPPNPLPESPNATATSTPNEQQPPTTFGLPILPSERTPPATTAPNRPVPVPVRPAPAPASGADADDDPTQFAPPPGNWGDTQPQITAFGDSVMLGARAFLVREFGEQITVDAVVSRQFLQLPKVIQQYRENPQNPPLGDVVLIHLGSNGYLNSKVFNQTMEQLSDIPRVLFVNVRVPRVWESEVNKQLAAGVERWENAYLVDWHGYSEGKEQEWLNSRDGVHMVPEGARAYTRLVGASL